MAGVVALLRAVNLGGYSTLPLADLRAITAAAGFANPRTFIASGTACNTNTVTRLVAMAARSA